MPYGEMYEDHNLTSIVNAIKGHRLNEESKFKHGWEKARYIAFHIINPWLPENDKMQKYSDVGEFPWEKEQEETKPEIEIKSTADLIKYFDE